MSAEFIQGEAKALTKRFISKETCSSAGYRVATVPEDYKGKNGKKHKMAGQSVQVADYYKNGKLVGQKLRNKDKEFAVIGEVSGSLFGMPLAESGGSKTLVITEGEIDALSYNEARPNWYAVSVPNGAQGARRCLEQNLEHLERWQNIILAFDNDEPGKDAALECASLFSPGKAKIANLDPEYKDFNEALVDANPKAIAKAVWNSSTITPDGLVEIDDILEEAKKPVEWGIQWWDTSLTELTYGRRFGEVYVLGAGTGIGKTDFLTQQIAFDIMELGMPVGCFFLEQKPVETAKRIAGKIANRNFHIPDSGWTQEELEETLNALKGRVIFYDSFGQTEWEGVKKRIRHLRFAKGIKVFYVDHLTAMADTAREKESIEQIMKEVAGLCQELGIIIHLVSHLATPEGTPHEEGGQVAARHFKGSRSIAFWAYFMFGLERNTQAEDMQERRTTTFRIVKDRYSGRSTGMTLAYGYDTEAGKLIAGDEIVDEEEEKF